MTIHSWYVTGTNGYVAGPFSNHDTAVAFAFNTKRDSREPVRVSIVPSDKRGEVRLSR